MQNVYENPVNGYREVGDTSASWFWCLCFGFFFLLYKGAWKGAIIGLVAAICTYGLAWFVMPFFARGIVRSAYLSRGWRLVPGGVAARPAERAQQADPGLNPTWPTPQPAAPPTGDVGASVADPGERGSNIVLAVLAFGLLASLIVFAAMSATGNKPRTAVPTGFTTVVEPSKASAQTTFRCSKNAVPLPAKSRPGNLQACRTAARAMLAAMLGNLRMTVACREEFVASLPKSLQSGSAAAQVRASNAGIRQLMASVEKGGEEQIRKADTLARCQAYLDNAWRFVEMQPEMKGNWN